MNKREARKVGLRIAAVRAGRPVQPDELHRAMENEGIREPLSKDDAKRIKDALAHIADHHTWEADGRPER